ncbi:hypothetical protein [Methylobacterium oryzae]|uniref:hypothetical protein n=1 Tax=Methylobacterium oryzae TaxID=334852 RepID=UPI002F35EBFB
MALLSDLVRIVAEVEGLEEVSVGIFARAAREAGFISQGGRGRSAAKMTARDAVNLLIAVNGCSLARDVPEMVEIIRNLPVAEVAEGISVDVGREGATFGSDLELLINMLAIEEEGENSIPGLVTVNFHRPIIKAEIEIFTRRGKHHVDQVAAYQDYSRVDQVPEPDRYDRTSVTQRTLYRVAKAIQR